MKIRSGFVSNSSSSSFVFVGFPASDIKPAVNPEVVVKQSLTARQIDEVAIKYFDDDKDYSDYKLGKADDTFWKYVYQNKCDRDEYDAPGDLDCITVDDVPWYGKRIARVEYGTVEVDLQKLSGTTAELISKYPGVNVRAFLSHSE